MKYDRIKELVDDERGRDLLYLIIGSLVSSDNLVDLESCEESLEKANLFKKASLESNIEYKDKYISLLDKVIPIIERDKKNYLK